MKPPFSLAMANARQCEQDRVPFIAKDVHNRSGGSEIDLGVVYCVRASVKACRAALRVRAVTSPELHVRAIGRTRCAVDHLLLLA
jgi:hypothetical protein